MIVSWNFKLRSFAKLYPFNYFVENVKNYKKSNWSMFYGNKTSILHYFLDVNIQNPTEQYKEISVLGSKCTPLTNSLRDSYANVIQVNTNFSGTIINTEKALINKEKKKKRE